MSDLCHVTLFFDPFLDDVSFKPVAGCSVDVGGYHVSISDDATEITLHCVKRDNRLSFLLTIVTEDGTIIHRSGDAPQGDAGLRYLNNVLTELKDSAGVSV